MRGEFVAPMLPDETGVALTGVRISAVGAPEKPRLAVNAKPAAETALQRQMWEIVRGGCGRDLAPVAHPAGDDTPPAATPVDIVDTFPRSSLNRGYFWRDLKATREHQPADDDDRREAGACHSHEFRNGVVACRGP